MAYNEFETQENIFVGLELSLDLNIFDNYLPYYCFGYMCIEESSCYVYLCYVYRNLAYQTRVQLAILDYNSHLSQEKAKNKDGIQMYHRKFRKRSKKWDATPMLKCKKYPHIPDLMKEIQLEYKNHDTALRVQVQSSHDSPTSIQKTIGNSQPETTNEIV